MSLRLLSSSACPFTEVCRSLSRPHRHRTARALSATGNAFFLSYCDSERLDARRLMSATLVSGNDVGRASVIPIEVNQVIADVVAIARLFCLNS